MRLTTTLANGQTIAAEGSNATEVRRALYQAACSASVVGEDDVPVPLNLETVRAWALAHVTEMRGKARARFIPNIAGQESVYQDKLQQAKDFAVDAAPTAARYPALYGEEAMARGLTPAQMATLIASKASAWRSASDKIEAATYEATNAVTAASTVAAIVDILVLLRTAVDS